MTRGFDTDVDRLAARARDFDGLVERAGTIAADLDRALDGAEAAWGDDVVGKSFAAAHAGPAGATADRSHGLAAGLREVGDSFGEAARRYRAADSGAVDSVSGAAVKD
ncbi:MAG TPA: hypothetical protein VJT49_13395 [Amycolatopsis sp.]|uniref:hypothetical protein n=1 Tax=Amycolatopsis sp. TaxID=37632 RepID=UPI002B46FE5A|nr:hypothetical protein [Amycolatopsis sp.]HJQ45759.1 hypothetical protein [Amycolatopsis sp.]HKS46081.1 hypothetical protein [Amycolatopsis sp.]